MFGPLAMMWLLVRLGQWFLIRKKHKKILDESIASDSSAPENVRTVRASVSESSLASVCRIDFLASGDGWNLFLLFRQRSAVMALEDRVTKSQGRFSVYRVCEP